MIRVLVTGGTNGIGKQLVKQLSQLPQYQVLFTARNEQLGNQVLNEVSSDKVSMHHLDLMQPDSISSLVSQMNSIDILVNNAAVNQPSAMTSLQTNVLGPIQLTNALLPSLLQSKEKKIINLGAKMASLSNPLLKTLPPPLLAYFQSILQEKQVDTSQPFSLSLLQDFQTKLETGEWKDDRKMKFPSASYLVSKMALHAYGVYLSEVYKQQGLQVASVDPGWCKTNLTNQSGPRSAEQGANAVLWAITHPLPQNGCLWDDGGKRVAY